MAPPGKPHLDSLHPLSHTLGRIEQALETITKTMSEDRLASAQYRTDMRRDLLSVRDMVHDLRNKVEHNSEDILEIRPDVEDWRIKRAQAKSYFSFASNSARVAWAIIGAAVTGLIAWFTNRP